jgi:hypothetical protein
MPAGGGPDKATACPEGQLLPYELLQSLEDYEGTNEEQQQHHEEGTGTFVYPLRLPAGERGHQDSSRGQAPPTQLLVLGADGATHWLPSTEDAIAYLESLAAPVAAKDRGGRSGALPTTAAIWLGRAAFSLVAGAACAFALRWGRAPAAAAGGKT